MIALGIEKTNQRIPNAAYYSTADELIIVTQGSGTCLNPEDFSIIELVESEHSFRGRAIGEVCDTVINANLIILIQDPFILHTNHIRTSESDHIFLAQNGIAHMSDELAIVMKNLFQRLDVSRFECVVVDAQNTHVF